MFYLEAMSNVHQPQSLPSKCRKDVIVDDFRYIVKNVDNMSVDTSVSSSELIYPPKVTVSGTDIRAKEVILVTMALCLLICSVCLFFKHWKKNYRDINQVRTIILGLCRCEINKMRRKKSVGILYITF